MSEILIVYKSITGFTEKYAHWIKDTLDADICLLDDLKHIKKSDYKIVIYGGGIKAGRIRGLKEFYRQNRNNNSKKVIIFATGGAPYMDNLYSRIKTENIKEEYDFFYFQSGINYESMKFFDRLLMYSYRMVLKLKKSKNHHQSGANDAMKSSYDNSSKAYIIPLVNHALKS